MQIAIMASRTRGIQHLLAAKKKATEKVTKAKKRKLSAIYLRCNSVFPKVGDIAALRTLGLSRGAVEVTSSIGGHCITKRGP